MNIFEESFDSNTDINKTLPLYQKVITRVTQTLLFLLVIAGIAVAPFLYANANGTPNTQLGDVVVSVAIGIGIAALVAMTTSFLVDLVLGRKYRLATHS